MARFTFEEATQLVDRFLGRKTMDPADLVRVPFALAFMGVWHLGTIATALTDLDALRHSEREQAQRLALYACSSCGSLTRVDTAAGDVPMSVACVMSTCEGLAHPLPKIEK